MPKVSASGQATAYGLEGIVRNAEGNLSELDPSRNLDGTAVDGFESDERDDLKDEKREVLGEDSEPRVQAGEQERLDAANERAASASLTEKYGDAPAEPAQPVDDEKDGASSRGNSSQTSTAKTTKKPNAK